MQIVIHPTMYNHLAATIKAKGIDLSPQTVALGILENWINTNQDSLGMATLDEDGVVIASAMEQELKALDPGYMTRRDLGIIKRG